jgi:hypothetical protein
VRSSRVERTAGAGREREGVSGRQGWRWSATGCARSGAGWRTSRLASRGKCASCRLMSSPNPFSCRLPAPLSDFHGLRFLSVVLPCTTYRPATLVTARSCHGGPFEAGSAVRCTVQLPWPPHARSHSRRALRASDPWLPAQSALSAHRAEAEARARAVAELEAARDALAADGEVLTTRIAGTGHDTLLASCVLVLAMLLTYTPPLKRIISACSTLNLQQQLLAMLLTSTHQCPMASRSQSVERMRSKPQQGRARLYRQGSPGHRLIDLPVRLPCAALCGQKLIG